MNEQPTSNVSFPFYGHNEGLVISGPDQRFAQRPMTPAELAARVPALTIAKDIYRHANQAGVCYVEMWELIAKAMQALLDERAADEPKAADDDEYVFAAGHYANCGVYEGTQRGPCSCRQIYEQNRAAPPPSEDHQKWWIESREEYIRKADSRIRELESQRDNLLRNCNYHAERFLDLEEAAKPIVAALKKVGDETRWADGDETDRVYAWHEMLPLVEALEARPPETKAGSSQPTSQQVGRDLPADETEESPIQMLPLSDESKAKVREAIRRLPDVQSWRCSICNLNNPDDATHCRQCEYSRMVTREGKLVPREGR